MTSREFAEWLAYYRLEPWGDDWDQAALLTAAIVNRDRTTPVAPEKFRPGRMARRKQSAREIQYRLDLMFRAAQKRHNKQRKQG